MLGCVLTDTVQYFGQKATKADNSWKVGTFERPHRYTNSKRSGGGNDAWMKIRTQTQAKAGKLGTVRRVRRAPTRLYFTNLEMAYETESHLKLATDVPALEVNMQISLAYRAHAA